MTQRLVGRLAWSVLVFSLMAADARAQYSRVSVANDGTQGVIGSSAADISADGRFVVFNSAAANLVANDTNNSTDIFVRDRTLNTTTRVSVTSTGAERTGDSTVPRISANGRFVVFLSNAPLVVEDTQTCQAPPAATACQDVYVHDRETGVTTRVSVSSQGTQADGDSFEPHISGDGRFVVFESAATNLVPGDTNGNRDAFLHDRQNGTTIRLLAAGALEQRFGEPEPRISADGSTIAFTGFVPPSALPLLEGGRSGPVQCVIADACPATFLYETATGTTTLVSAALPGSQLGSLLFQDECNFISADGRVMVIKQVTIVPGSNPLRADARFIVYDRVTGGMRVGAWRSREGADVIGLSGDGRYDVRLVKPTNPLDLRRWRVFRDRVSGLDEMNLIDETTGSLDDPVEMSLSHDARFAAFVTRLPLVSGDTNGSQDVYVLDRDTDGDGMPSQWETSFGLNANDPSDATGDPDADSLTNVQEYVQGSHPDKGFTRYLAEGAANEFMTTRLAIFNPNDTPVQAAFRLLGSSGNRTTLTRGLAPRGRSTIVLARGGEAPENDFSTIIESTQPIVVDRTMTWDSRRFGAHSETSVASPATTWHLAEGATHGAFDLFYLLLNTTGSDATATVKYLRPSPLPPVIKTYHLTPNGRRTIWVDAEGPELAETDVSAVVTADQPIVVERAMYASAGGVPFAAGHEGMGITEPALQWFLAEGATGNFFDLFVLIANPGTAAAEVSVKYLLPDNQSFTKTYRVAGEGRVTISVDGEDVRLANTPVSMIVTSTNNQPIIVERSMWWPSPNWYEAHLAAGVTTTGTKWAFADGEISTRSTGDPTETYILIANTSTTPGTATISLFNELLGASGATFTVPLPPESRVSVPTADRFGRENSARFGAIIESDGVPIVVERSTYITVDNVTWSAGTAAVATKLQ